MNTRLLGLGLLLLAGFVLLNPKARQAAMSAFEKIKGLIAGEEGLRLTAYQDPVGKWTIGYGHLIKPGEPYYPYGPVQTITQAQADALFDADTAAAQACVRSAVKVPISNDQFASLVSFVFNTGCGALQSSTLLKLINARQFAQAAAEFDKWVFATNASGQKVKLPGLIARREREKQSFIV
jgi:GH24 family phage-related lysozyme (muramidase)